jgi:thiol-disulfide isomerase/thioredoxin
MKTSFCLIPLALLLAACQPPAPEAAAPAPVAEEAPAAEVTPAAGPAPAAEPPAAAEPAAAETAPAEPPTHPTLVVETLDHGRFDLQAKRGGWVVVNFWATWCKPCLKEIPDFTAFDAARDDVSVIGLAYEEIEPEAMREFLKKHPAGYPIALLDVYDPPADFATPRGLPMTYLIAPDGSVAERFLGPVTSQDLAAAIEKAGAAAG